MSHTFGTVNGIGLDGESNSVIAKYSLYGSPTRIPLMECQGYPHIGPLAIMAAAIAGWAASLVLLYLGGLGVVPLWSSALDGNELNVLQCFHSFAVLFSSLLS